MFGTDPNSMAAMAPTGMQFAAPPQRAGMFGGKFGVGQALVAALNGYLASTAGPSQQVGMNNIQMMAAQRQRQLEHQQELDDYNRKRTDDNSDWQTHKDYELAHQPPPDIVERIAALNAQKPGLGDTYAQNYAQNGGGMGPMLVNPVTGQQMAPAAKAPAQAPPPEAVARLRSNPAESQQFDEIFGPGTSASILGGPTQPASGGFPQ